jgi:hypothetical protein
MGIEASVGATKVLWPGGTQDFPQGETCEHAVRLPATQSSVGTLHHIRIPQRAFGSIYSRFISAVSPLDRRRALHPIQSSSFAARNRQATGGAYVCSNRSISAATF